MADEFKGSKAFIMNFPSITRDKELLKRPKSILLMGEIISMLNVTGSFYMSNKTIAGILDCTPQAVNNYLALLEKKKLIKRKKVTDKDNPKRILGRQILAGDALVKQSLLGWSTGIGKGSQSALSRVVNASLHKYNSIKDHNNRSSNNNSPAKAEQDIPYKEIIAYLNSKTGKNLHYQTKSYQRLIRARWNDGATLQDFKTVINNKAYDWQNTPYWKYMQPSTLFRQSKFDEYLNENTPATKQPPKNGGYGANPQDNLDGPY